MNYALQSARYELGTAGGGYELCATRCDLQARAMRCELRAMSYALRAASYES